MSNYTKTTNFAAKDSLPSGDAGKIIQGTEFNTEFDDIATAIATKSSRSIRTGTGGSGKIFTNLDNLSELTNEQLAALGEVYKKRKGPIRTPFNKRI